MDPEPIETPALTPSSLPSAVESVLPTAAAEDQDEETAAADGTPASTPGSRSTLSPRR